MEDTLIVELYWARDEAAIKHSKDKYGNYCYKIAYNILSNNEDSEECVNDTWVGAWNSMPPNRPSFLGAFLGKITRNISLKRWRDAHAKKRGGDETALVLEELEECLPSGKSVEEEVDARQLTGHIEGFIKTLSASEQKVFIRRYYYLEKIPEVALRTGFSESKVKSMLFRLRGRLKLYLEREGYDI